MRERKLYLIRHAAVVGEGRFNGYTDVPLSEAGQAQARALADRAQPWEADLVVGSDMLRVRQTAQPLLEASGLELQMYPNLRERHFGKWEGLSWEEIQSGFAAEAQAFLDGFYRLPPPRGESLIQMERRVCKAWRQIWNQPWERLILIAHGGTNRLLLRSFLKLPLRNIFRLGQNYAAVNEVEFHGEIPLVVRLNDSS